MANYPRISRKDIGSTHLYKRELPPLEKKNLKRVTRSSNKAVFKIGSQASS
jgi:hypothetical protein